jgi:hypothetical protein
VPTLGLICIQAVNGGLFVALFAVVGEMLQPKRFAGVFGASPAVALANLLVIGLAQGDAKARDAAAGMIAGGAALAVACAAAIPAVRRWGAVLGSAVVWGVWIVAGAAIAVPVVGGSGAAAGVAPAPGAGGRSRRQRQGRRSRKAHVGGLFSVDFGTLREIRPGDLVLRFAFGAAISVVAGLVAVAAGTRAGGIMLASPAVLPATLTIIEKQEGRGPAVTEVQGAVPGAVALLAFALVAAASLAVLPLGGALLVSLAAWAAVGVGGYLALAAVVPAWQQDVRMLAGQRRDAAQARRGRARPGAGHRSG